MPAIWGAVSLNGKPLPLGTGPRMKKAYDECVIDKICEYEDEYTLLGCGLQYITCESRYEKLPICDNESQIYFTADIMLDNREELLDKLKISGDASQIADGDIAYEMIRRYGEGCLNDLLGAYSFVYYDKKNRRVSMVLDATGNRCLYYRLKDGVLYFSSLIGAILGASGNYGVNERWLTDFLAMDNLALMTEYEETAFDQVYRVSPRQIVTVGDGYINKHIYWNPDMTELHLKSDAEYASLLNETYLKSVKCLLRSEKTSILLSGGLDSTSVACYAARELKKQGKALYTYTSVPESGYVSNLRTYYMTDESESVLKTKAYLENEGCSLVCNFIDLAGINCWDGRTAEMKAMETPYKSMQNLLWISEAMRASYASGSRVLLNGNFGNVTISASIVDIYLTDLLNKNKYITFFRQFHRFSRSFGHGRKTELKRIVKKLYEYVSSGPSDTGGRSLIGNSYIREEMLEKHLVRERFSKAEKQMASLQKDFKKYQSQTVNDLIFSQIGESNTKHSLMTGAVTRDPTIDKRIVELCLRFPADQFARDGIYRRPVREYMKDYMPAHVINSAHKGMQSADTIERAARHQGRVLGEISGIYSENSGSLLVDCEKALKDLDAMDNDFKNAKTFDFLRICYTAMVLEFVRNAENPAGY